MKSQGRLAKRFRIGVLLFGAITGAVIASMVCLIKCQIIGNQIGSAFASQLIPNNPAVTLFTTPDSKYGYMFGFPTETLALLTLALSLLMPIGSLLGAGLWWLYSLTSRFQKGASSFNILVAFPTFAIICAALIWQCFPNTSTAFIPSRWAQNISERQAMFADLSAHQELKGKHRNIIEDLLGEPDATSILHTKSPNTVAYHCGLNQLLVLSYDPKDESIARYDLVPFDVPDNAFVEAAMPIAYDYQGHPLSWQTESFQLASNLASIDVGGKRIQSPENIREQTKAVLAKQVDSNGCLRVIPTEPPISDWTAAKLNDGKILICGCSEYDSDPCQRSTWVFDSANASIMKGPAMSERRAKPMLTLHDGRVLIAGGLGFHGRRLASCELYDQPSNTLTGAGSLLIPRSESGIAQLSNGDVLIVGGKTNEGLSDAGGQLTSTAELMSLRDGKVEHRFAGNLPIGRYDPIVVPSDHNRALVVGGWWVYGLMEDERYYRGANVYIGNKE